jgi:peptidoglycan hydrolase-like protein with peptidoglycan-binding domain
VTLTTLRPVPARGPRSGRAVLAALLLLTAGEAAAQAPPGAVGVALRPDPVTREIREVVLGPLSPAAVRAVQEARVRSRHRDVRLTGELDQPTRAAIRAFQVERGLRITGRPDAETVRALGVPVVRVPDAAAPGAVPRRAPTLIVIGPDADVVRPRDPAPIGAPIGPVAPGRDPRAGPSGLGAGSSVAPPAAPAAPGEPAAPPDPAAPPGPPDRSSTVRPRRARHTRTHRRP